MDLATSTRIIESKFFSPVFNTAIFDGPIKLYFSQAQESDALKVYFKMQSRFQELNPEIGTPNSTFQNQKIDKTIFIMIYPNKETFVQSFDQDQEMAVEDLETDIVIGIQSPVSEKLQDQVLNKLDFILGKLDFK